jgi:hypothetical protein
MRIKHDMRKTRGVFFSFIFANFCLFEMNLRIMKKCDKSSVFRFLVEGKWRENLMKRREKEEKRKI